jgi:hypothetical protein
MTDFVLEISGVGKCIALRPRGTIDLAGAQTLVDAIESVRVGSRTALLEIDLEHITGCTPDAQALLASRAVGLSSLAALAATA